MYDIKTLEDIFGSQNAATVQSLFSDQDVNKMIDLYEKDYSGNLIHIIGDQHAVDMIRDESHIRFDQKV